ncbi:MAG: 4Fe-4S binding protein [Candidatus Adiutrix sp.]|jgi:ferredoxin|nr:4Fe-4S binding protein [Candidatus Adiutrix sp.]
MSLRLRRLRRLVQHVCFVVLMYGGRFGLRLGPALPCFSCPFVAGCGGHCYLMGLQGYIGFGLNAAALGSAWLLTSLGWLAVFIILTAVLGKAWCGWVCPFGLIQDWLTALRRRLGLRERRISPAAKKKLGLIKYGLVVYLAAVPPLITLGLLHEDFYLPFCNICPGKALLPLFAGETRYLAVNLNNQVTIAFSVALLTITGLTLTGMFFKERFFCLFCPMLALIHLLKPLTALRLIKKPGACVGCGNCRRACPMDIEEVRERLAPDVQTDECLDCGGCVEACPSNSALALKFMGRKLFASSRAYAAGFVSSLIYSVRCAPPFQGLTAFLFHRSFVPFVRGADSQRLSSEYADHETPGNHERILKK